MSALLTGCAQHDLAYRPGGPTVIIKASGESQYNLYAAGNKVPLYCDLLLEREPVGFIRDESGNLQAIAGEQVHVLEEGRYKWKRLPQVTQGGVSDRSVSKAETVFAEGLIILSNLGKTVRTAR